MKSTKIEMYLIEMCAKVRANWEPVSQHQFQDSLGSLLGSVNGEIYRTGRELVKACTP
jgi:hypothetical protein